MAIPTVTALLWVVCLFVTTLPPTRTASMDSNNHDPEMTIRVRRASVLDIYENLKEYVVGAYNRLMDFLKGNNPNQFTRSSNDKSRDVSDTSGASPKTPLFEFNFDAITEEGVVLVGDITPIVDEFTIRKMARNQSMAEGVEKRTEDGTEKVPDELVTVTEKAPDATVTIPDQSETPGDSEKVPDESGNNPGESDKRPDDAEKVPEVSGIMPDGSGKVPDDSGKVPDESGNMPESNKRPDDAEKVPEMTEIMPDESGKVPDESGKMPESEKIPDESGKVSGDSENAPKASEKMPNESTNNSGKMPDVTEEPTTRYVTSSGDSTTNVAITEPSIETSNNPRSATVTKPTQTNTISLNDKYKVKTTDLPLSGQELTTKLSKTTPYPKKIVVVVSDDRKGVRKNEVKRDSGFY